MILYKEKAGERMQRKRKAKIRESYRFLFVILMMLLVGILLIASISALLLSLTSITSDNVFSLQKAGDWLFLIAWLASASLSVWTIYRASKQRALDRKTMPLILALFNLAILISSMIPLLTVNEHATEEGVRNVISNTGIFYYTAVGSLIVTFSVTLFLLRKKITERSNWYVFLASIPYVIAGWVIQRGYTALQELKQSNDYSYQMIANALSDNHQYPYMINEKWFTFLALIILNFILILGVNLLEFIWHQTEAYRQGRSNKKTKKAKKQN